MTDNSVALMRNYLPRLKRFSAVSLNLLFPFYISNKSMSMAHFVAEVGNVVQFGRSIKRTVDSKMIGQYGNGLKS